MTVCIIWAIMRKRNKIAFYCHSLSELGKGRNKRRRWEGKFTPYVYDIINTNCMEGRYWSCIVSSDKNGFVSNSHEEHIVSLNERTCTCLLFQVLKISCVHACFFNAKQNLLDFCSQSYSVDCLSKNLFFRNWTNSRLGLQVNSNHLPPSAEKGRKAENAKNQRSQWKWSKRFQKVQHLPNKWSHQVKMSQEVNLINGVFS